MFPTFKSLESSLHRWPLLLFVVFLSLSLPAIAGGTFQIDPRQESMSAGFTVANNDSWEKFRRIRQGEDPDSDTVPVGAEKVVESSKKNISAAKHVQQAPASLAPSAQQTLPATKGNGSLRVIEPSPPPPPPLTPQPMPPNPPPPPPDLSVVWPPKKVIVNDSNHPTKADASQINVVVPNNESSIYWLPTKIPVTSTYRYQGYFANTFPWVAKGVVVPEHTFTSSIWLPTQTPFKIHNLGHYPVTYQVPQGLKGGEKMTIGVTLYGWFGGSSYCENFGDAAPNSIAIRNCSSEYPLGSFDAGLGWWSYFGAAQNNGVASNADGERIAESVLSVMARHADSVDADAGITFGGNSYGGGGSIIQSMVLPRIQNHIALVYSIVPTMLLVKNELVLSPYPKVAWGKNMDQETLDSLDFRKVAPSGKLNNIFYRIVSGSDDDRNSFDAEFYVICNQYKMPCLGTWHKGGHSGAEPGINLTSDVYPDPKMKSRLDRVLPVFTNSTANTKITTTIGTNGNVIATTEPRGHYNLGLSWNDSGILQDAGQLTMPLKYKAYKNFSSDQVSKPFPDMLDNITASVTIRRSKIFMMAPGDTIKWSFGTVGAADYKSGTVKADSLGEVTIDNLPFTTSESVYKNLVLTK